MCSIAAIQIKKVYFIATVIVKFSDRPKFRVRKVKHALHETNLAECLVICLLLGVETTITSTDARNEQVHYNSSLFIHLWERRQNSTTTKAK